MSASFSPSITRHASLASGIPTAFDTNGTVRDARGFASITYRSSPVTANWMLIRPTTPSPSASLRRRLLDLAQHLRAERHRGDDAGRVARVDAGLLDVLHDRADVDGLAVGQRVDVDLDRVLEEAVEVDLGALLRAGSPEVVGQALDVVDRSPSPGRRARTRGGRAAGTRPCSAARAPGRARWPSRTAAPPGRARWSSPWKRERSSARSIESTGVPSSGTPASARPCASRSGVWPPKDTITPSGCSTSITPSTSSSVSGSKYRRSDVS